MRALRWPELERETENEVHEPERAAARPAVDRRMLSRSTSMASLLDRWRL